MLKISINILFASFEIGLGVKFTLEIVIVNVSDQILFKESQNIQRF
jgi:hypothetical protein